MKAMERLDFEEWRFVAAVLFPEGLEPSRNVKALAMVYAIFASSQPIQSAERLFDYFREGKYYPSQWAGKKESK